MEQKICDRLKEAAALNGSQPIRLPRCAKIQTVEELAVDAFGYIRAEDIAVDMNDRVWCNAEARILFEVESVHDVLVLRLTDGVGISVAFGCFSRRRTVNFAASLPVLAFDFHDR